jgi:hypothetical protein
VGVVVGVVDAPALHQQEEPVVAFAQYLRVRRG